MSLPCTAYLYSAFGFRFVNVFIIFVPNQYPTQNEKLPTGFCKQSLCLSFKTRAGPATGNTKPGYQKKIVAGWIGTCVGSLKNYNIRFANQPKGSKDSGHFEIVSLTGTVSTNGSHLHISISDSTGKTIGGHLMEGCSIYTTAEIVILTSNDFIFKRAKDGTTPWEELQVEEIKK